MADTQRFMTFGEHLDDLRRRLMWALVGVGALFVLGLVFGGPLLELLCRPLLAQLRAAGEAPVLLATSPVETFGSYIMVATVGALVAGMPWVIYQAWLFVAPGLYAPERRFVYFLVPLSGVLPAAGMAALYFVILPVSLYFLITFGSGIIEQRTPAITELPPGVSIPSLPVLAGDPAEPIPGQQWVNSELEQIRICLAPGRIRGVPLTAGGGIAQQYRISEYVKLVFLLGLAFALAFQVPLVLLLLGWGGVLGPEDLTKYRRHIIFGCVVGAALLPTQDPWSLFLLSGLMYGLFEFGIVLMRFVPARRVARGLARRKVAPPRRTDGDEEV